MSKFSENFKKFRKENFLQIELAKILSVDRVTISNWENGKYEPSILQLMNIANLMDISLDELVGRDFEYRDF